MAKDTKKKSSSKAEAPSEPAAPPRLKIRYEQEVSSKIAEQFGRANPVSLPKLDRIVLNVNMGRHLESNKLPPNLKEAVQSTLGAISGQRPVIVKAKKSVSNFKVRAGAETAAMVTLRRERMWHFLDRLINLAIPRTKDFRGLSDKSFDSNGNYSMGLTEQGVFPEIDMGHTNVTHGMNINIVFRNSNPQISRFLLAELGMPFRKPEEN